MAGGATQEQEEDRAWETVLTNGARLMFLGSVPLGLQFVISTPGIPMRSVVAMVFVTAVAAVASFARFVSLAVRGYVLGAALLCFATVITHDLGPRPAAVLALQTASLIAALLYGWKVGVGVQAISSAFFFIAGITAPARAAAGFAADLGRTEAWVRMALTQFVLGGVLIVVVATAFRRVAESLRRARAAEAGIREGDERLRFALDAAAVGTWSMDVKSGVVDWSRNVDRVVGVDRERLPRNREEALALIHPDDRPAGAAAFDDVLSGRTPELRTDHRLLTPDGRVIWVETRARIRRDSRTGAPRLTGTMVDVSARLEAEARRAQAQATLLVLAGSAAVRRGDREAALRELTEAGTRLLGAARCGVWLLEEDGRVLRCVHLHEAESGDHARGPAIDAAAAPAYFEALTGARCIAAADAAADPRTRELGAGYLAPNQIAALLDAPIFLEGRVAGVLCHEHVGREPRVWTDEEEELAGSLADCVARALEALARAEARERLQRAYDELGALSRRMETAKEEERRRIAHELHDELGQTVTAMKINLQLAGAPDAPPPAPGWVADMVGLADRTIQVVRALSHSLRPPLLDELGLVAALRAFLEEQGWRANLSCKLDAPEDLGKLPPEIEIVAFRVVQEAVTNAVRHAQARSVRVSIARAEGTLRVSVRDDGRGFDVEAAFARAIDGGNLGLVGMRERARALGGKFEVRGKAGDEGGAQVSVELPVA